MEAIRSSETSVLTINTWRKIPEDGFLHYNIPYKILLILNVGSHLSLHNISQFREEYYHNEQNFCVADDDIFTPNAVKLNL
jgi:hypothetical protein